MAVLELDLHAIDAAHFSLDLDIKIYGPDHTYSWPKNTSSENMNKCECAKSPMRYVGNDVVGTVEKQPFSFRPLHLPVLRHRSLPWYRPDLLAFLPWAWGPACDTHRAGE